MTPASIDIQGVNVRYGRRVVVRDAHLHVPAGQTTVLLGRNGEGKTTLLKACLGVLKPSQGSVRIAGLDPIRRASAVRRLVGYVPDKPDVWGWMDTRDLPTCRRWMWSAGWRCSNDWGCRPSWPSGA